MSTIEIIDIPENLNDFPRNNKFLVRTDISKEITLPNGETVTVYRIQCIRQHIHSYYLNVPKGALGGWVSGVHNLTAKGGAWILPKAIVCQRAFVQGGMISGHAVIYGNASVHGQNTMVTEHATVGDYACVSGDAHVCGNAKLRDRAKVSGEATRIYGNAEIKDFAKVIGRYCTVEGNAVIGGKATIESQEAFVVIKDNVVIDGSIHLRGQVRLTGNLRLSHPYDMITFSVPFSNQIVMWINDGGEGVWYARPEFFPTYHPELICKDGSLPSRTDVLCHIVPNETVELWRQFFSDAEPLVRRALNYRTKELMHNGKQEENE